MHDDHDDKHNNPADNQPLYILTQEHYDELRHAQTMLVVRAQASYSDEDIEKDTLRPIPHRSDMSRFFAEVSVKIGSALDAIRKDNCLDPPRKGRRKS